MIDTRYLVHGERSRIWIFWPMSWLSLSLGSIVEPSLDKDEHRLSPRLQKLNMRSYMGQKVFCLRLPWHGYVIPETVLHTALQPCRLKKGSGV